MKVIYTKHPTVGEFLYNHKRAVQSWSTSTTPHCACELLRAFPDAVIPGTDHIVLDASRIAHAFTNEELAMLTGSMSNKFFPSYRQCLQTFIHHLDTWTRRNGLPPLNLHLWREHLPHSAASIFHHTISTVQSRFPNCVFHCENKEASSLRIFCPQLYATCIHNTFMDPKVFSPVPLSPKERVAAYVLDITDKFGATHPWALGPLVLDDNYQLDTCYLRRRNTTTVDAPSSASLKPRSDQCSIPWPHYFTASSHQDVPTILRLETCTPFYVTITQFPPTSTLSFETKTWQASL